MKMGHLFLEKLTRVSGASLKILSTSLGLETMTYFLPALY
jgi:hypothetical protein